MPSTAAPALDSVEHDPLHGLVVRPGRHYADGRPLVLPGGILPAEIRGALARVRQGAPLSGTKALVVLAAIAVAGLAYVGFDLVAGPLRAAFGAVMVAVCLSVTAVAYLRFRAEGGRRVLRECRVLPSHTPEFASRRGGIASHLLEDDTEQLLVAATALLVAHPERRGEVHEILWDLGRPSPRTSIEVFDGRRAVSTESRIRGAELLEWKDEIAATYARWVAVRDVTGEC